MNDYHGSPNDFRCYLQHYGIKGMHWGIRRFQNLNGSLTTIGKIRYGVEGLKKINRKDINTINQDQQNLQNAINFQQQQQIFQQQQQIQEQQNLQIQQILNQNAIDFQNQINQQNIQNDIQTQQIMNQNVIDLQTQQIHQMYMPWF